MSTLETYYSNKLIKIDKVDEILIKNKNKYNQGEIYDTIQKFTGNLKILLLQYLIHNTTFIIILN